jgi:hypothetical protein
MPAGGCYANATAIANEYSELEYQQGILVMIIDGKPIASVCHAWNTGPAGQIIDTTQDGYLPYSPARYSLTATSQTARNTTPNAEHSLPQSASPSHPVNSTRKPTGALPTC